MSNSQRVFNKETLTESWNDGSTSWVVYGPDGIRFFRKKDDNSIESDSEFLVENLEDLFDKLRTFFFMNDNPLKRNEDYEVYAN